VDFFTSDIHFGHKNIIRFCNRPFKTLKDMHESIIRNWNSIVTDADRVFVVGDVFLCDPAEAKNYLDELNGYKILIKGNHDRSEKTMLWAGFDEYHYDYTYEMRDGRRALVQHYPLPELLIKEHDILIHGHIHHLPQMRGNKINVCCDLWDFKPIPISVIEEANLTRSINDEKVEIHIDNSMLSVNFRIATDDFSGVSAHIISELKQYYLAGKDKER